MAATKSRRADAPRRARRPAASDPVFHFFAGKGGVGKTTLAAAAARHAAALGRRVLVVSTDPAHSLGDALGRRLSGVPRRVSPLGPPEMTPRLRRTGRRRRGRLEAVELDAAAALARWSASRRGALEKVLLRGTVFDRQDVARLLELPLPGLDELVALAAVDQMARDRRAELAIIDTAPTGHTWRLLDAPETIAGLAGVMDAMLARDRLIADAIGGRPLRDAADAIVEELAADAARLATRLRAPQATRISWVTLAEPVAVAEAVDGVAWLRARGLPLTEIVVNRSVSSDSARPLRSGAAACRICRARSALERSALAPLRRAAPGVPFRFVPERGASQARRGLRASRALTTLGGARDFAFTQRRPARRTSPVSSSLRLLFVGGKGGVGKTSAAAAMAIDAASHNHGRRVLLLSTDPAHSLGDVLGIQLGDTPRAVPGVAGMLEAREIDADAALARQREALRAAVEQMFEGYARTGGEAGRSGVGVDLSHDRAAAASLLDLSPPGLDEIVALLSVVDALEPHAAANRGTTLPPSRSASADRRSLGGGGQGRRSEGYDLVVVDTAPTGHALKLLAMPELAERWAAALMRLLLKYRDVARVGPLAEPLVELSKGTKRLQALLHDRRAAQVVAVTRPAALPRMETMRLMDALRRLRIAVPTVVVNAVTPSPRRSADARCARCRAARALERSEIAALARPLRCDIIFAPLVLPPPRGPARLTRWMRQWQKWNRSRDMPRTSTPS